MITYSTGSTYNRPVGTMATYSCNTGYALNGGSTRTCQLGWTWSGSAPACKGTLGLHTVRHKCHSNRGRWCVGWFLTKVNTQHTAICSTLPMIRNGQIAYNFLQSPVVEGIPTALFSCNDGYQMMGVNVSLCQANGMWSSSTPKCVGKFEKPAWLSVLLNSQRYNMGNCLGGKTMQFSMEFWNESPARPFFSDSTTACLIF